VTTRPPTTGLQDFRTLDRKTIHLAWRLNYLAVEEAEVFIGQTKQAFACLHGLIKAVEREAGRFNKIAATVTSLLVLNLARWSSGQ
jgi:hypothetical protein